MALAINSANNDFTTDLYGVLFPKTCSGNLIFSPFSLGTVLALISFGAKGNTKAEILRGLKIAGNNDDGRGEGYRTLINDYQKISTPATFALLMANKIYSQTGFSLDKNFVNALKKYFSVDFEQLDFSSADKCKEATKKINTWVETTTKSKIKELIPSGVIDSNTRLVVVNGIYFKGMWEHRFNPKKTSKAKFRISESQEVDVDMMFIEEKFASGELPELDADAVAIPYKGGRLSMVIILPKTVNGLAKIQSSIGSLLRGGKSLVKERLTVTHTVELHLPKFKIEATINNLKEVLLALGMKSMFSATDADFGGISTGKNPGLYVTSIIQKAFIEVNEEGTEAAAATAATGVVMMARSMPITIPFDVIHPFYYQIVDNANGDLVLFSGHCIDPAK